MSEKNINEILEHIRNYIVLVGLGVEGYGRVRRILTGNMKTAKETMIVSQTLYAVARGIREVQTKFWR